MQQLLTVRTGLSAAAALAAALSLAACSTPQASTGDGTLGYGTPGVSSYMADGQAGGLQAELDRCRHLPQAGVPGQPQGLTAACDQLHRTLRNQPGNSVK